MKIISAVALCTFTGIVGYVGANFFTPDSEKLSNYVPCPPPLFEKQKLVVTLSRGGVNHVFLCSYHNF